ncbi:hypothetical protein FA13DRAFT_721732 [Coprinellus micaceus]|uniref:Uncharacterized protein n=1 Tax=Coprinellus micaceus TaxID=71717 RepID=A0A4Y7TV72_COPMI|nr:hypothetical protein FA13DRAFT_721732 [Coprinellus micaceus]
MPHHLTPHPWTGLKRTYEAQHRLDREADIHGPELYAVWNAKPFFVDAAVKEMRREGKVYDYVFWVGCWYVQTDPHVSKMAGPQGGSTSSSGKRWNTREPPLEKQEKDVILFPINDIPSYWYRHWTEFMGPVDFIFSKGSFFGGSPSGLKWYSDTFYAYHHYFLSLGYFVGKDQNTINALLLLFPHRFAVQWQRDPRTAAQLWPRGKCGTEWYYYLHVLAGAEERDAMEKAWKWSMDGFQEGKLWRKARELHPDTWRRCPVSPGLSFQRVAQETFWIRLAEE